MVRKFENINPLLKVRDSTKFVNFLSSIYTDDVSNSAWQQYGWARTDESDNLVYTYHKSLIKKIYNHFVIKEGWDDDRLANAVVYLIKKTESLSIENIIDADLNLYLDEEDDDEEWDI